MNINEESPEHENQLSMQKERELESPAEQTSSKQEEAEAVEEQVSNEVHAESNEEDESDELETDEYTGLEKAQLIKKLKELTSIEDTEHTHHTVRKIKEAYAHFPKETEEGEAGDPENTPSKNPEDEAFYTLLKIYKQKREKQKKEKDKTYQENLAEKKAIIHELKTLPENSQNISSAFEKFHELQTRWRSIGPVPAAHILDMRESYQFNIKKFFDGLKINKELRELDMKKNLELKNELIAKAEELSKEPSIRKALETYRHLSDQWREIGHVSKEMNDPIWDKFKLAGEHIYQRRKEHLDEVGSKQNENLNHKNELLQKMEAILGGEYNRHKHWQDASEKVSALMEEWIKTGRVPKAHNAEVWKKFRELRQKFFHAKEKFYEGIHHEQQHNLEIKTALCVQAEALMENTNWKEGTEQLKKLQASWKESGPVPFKVSDKIWKRFRKACDTFFEHKNSFYSKIDEQKLEHVKVKEALIEKVRNFAPTEDEKESYMALRQMREEWKLAGDVPLKDRDVINDSFRKAMDQQMEFLRKKSGNSELFQQIRFEELKHSEKGMEQLQKEKAELQHRIKKLQADVSLLENNLGFFGHSKNAEKMKEEYALKVEHGKTEIQKLKERIKMMG